MLKIGVLGRLYLDDYYWEPVNLIVSKENVKKNEEINDLSQFYLQNLYESCHLQQINSEDRIERNKRRGGHEKPSQKKHMHMYIYTYITYITSIW